MTPGTGNPKPPTITVVVPVRDGARDLDRCLQAIGESSRPPLECIVVDDASSDASAEVALRHGARVIRLDRQHGPAYARNRGATEARGDLLFFTDADVRVHADALEVAARAFVEHPECGAVIGSYDDEPGHPSFLSQYKNLFHHWVHQTSSETAWTFWTGLGAVRRAVFIESGGFNEGYTKPSIEDIEFGFRLRAMGRRIRLEKRLLGTHLKRWGFWNLLHTDVFRRGTPWIALLLRDRFARKDLNLSSESRYGTILAALLVLALAIAPLVGHAAAALPFVVATLAAFVCVPLRERTARTTWRTPAALAMLVLGPLAAFALAPDPLATVPFALWLGIAWPHRRFYRFMRRKRGIVFACAVAPQHVIFLLCCCACVPLGVLTRRLDRRRARRSMTGPALRSLSPLSVPQRDERTTEVGA